MSIRELMISGEEVLGAMKFEFFSSDMAQTGIGHECLKAPSAAARRSQIKPMVRVPRGEHQFFARALDIGIRGVLDDVREA